MRNKDFLAPQSPLQLVPLGDHKKVGIMLTARLLPDAVTERH